MVKYSYGPLKKEWLIFSKYCSFSIFSNSDKVNSPNYFLTHIVQVNNYLETTDPLCHGSLFFNQKKQWKDRFF